MILHRQQDKQEGLGHGGSYKYKFFSLTHLFITSSTKNFARDRSRFARLCSLALLLLGSWLKAPIANAKPLPPPPIFDNNLPPAQPTLPPASSPVQVPSGPDRTQAPSRNLEFEAPPSRARSRRDSTTGRIYEVDVYGDNPMLLAQVQRIVPDAFVRHRDGVIQAGAFVEKSYAVERVQLLEAQGIRAQIRTVSARSSDSSRRGSDVLRANDSISVSNSPRLTRSSPAAASDFPNITGNSSGTASDSPRTTDTAPTVSGDFPIVDAPRAIGNPPVALSDSHSLGRSYFVVIPGGRKNLDNMASQIVRLGVSREAVLIREGPRGPHLAVGPFAERGQAERWSSYLRSSGMDARVYFGR